MKVRIKRCLMVVLMAMGMLLSVMTASAYQNEEQGTGEVRPTEERTSAEPSVIKETQVADGVVVERKTETGEPTDGGEESAAGLDVALDTAAGDTPFSIPGNGLLLDDKSADGTKQFLTIRTKNGNTFFMVLDRSNHTENVYMLSMIDENDLAEFVEDAQDQPKTGIPSVVLPQKDTAATVPGQTDELKRTDELEQTDKLEQKKTGQEKDKTEGMNMSMILVFIVILMGGIGVFYYLKVLRPKRAEEDAEVENLEFCDDGTYINEDLEEEEE